MTIGGSAKANVTLALDAAGPKLSLLRSRLFTMYRKHSTKKCIYRSIVSIP